MCIFGYVSKYLVHGTWNLLFACQIPNGWHEFYSNTSNNLSAFSPHQLNFALKVDALSRKKKADWGPHSHSQINLSSPFNGKRRRRSRRNMNNTTVAERYVDPQDNLTCPDYTDFDKELIANTDYWLDGVIKVSLAIWGLLSNVIGLVVLNRPKMKNSFNVNLSALAVIDVIYLTLEIFKTLYMR